MKTVKGHKFENSQNKKNVKTVKIKYLENGKNAKKKIQCHNVKKNAQNKKKGENAKM